MSADEWISKNWADLRDNTDDALKLTAMLPSAADAYQSDGGDMFQEILSQLSTKLYCLNMFVGDHRPGHVPPRPPDPCRIDPTVWRSLKIINDLVAPLLADASGPNAQPLRVIASHLQQVRGCLGNQDWEARKDDPPTPAQRSYFEDRDVEIGAWLGEITELTSEALADAYHRDVDDLDQLQHLHARLWRMRTRFGFTPKAVDSEATE